MKLHFYRHSCPNCGHYVGWRRIYFGSRYAQWACEACDSPLCYDAKSKWLSLLVTFAWLILAELLFMRFHLIHWWGFMLLALSGIFPAVNVLKVILDRSGTTEPADLREHAKDA